MSIPTKLQVLLSKKRYLTLEYEHVKSLHDEYSVQFNEMLKNHIKTEETMENQQKEKKSKKIEKKSKTAEKQSNLPVTKSLYRKIASVTHPDKIQDKKLNRMYRQATEARDTSNVIELIDICDQLDIQIPAIGKRYYDLIQKNISKLANDINMIKRADCYVWGEADEESKQKYEQLIVKRLQKNK